MKSRHLFVSDLMTTAVQTIRMGSAVGQADADMRLAGIRHLPVVDERGRLVGILSNRDLLAALGRSRGRAVPVTEIMSRDVRTIGPEDSARRAAAIMLEHKFGCLPVVGDGGELIGLVTETDFLRLCYELLV